jgi:hypothetical protein
MGKISNRCMHLVERKPTRLHLQLETILMVLQELSSVVYVANEERRYDPFLCQVDVSVCSMPIIWPSHANIARQIL